MNAEMNYPGSQDVRLAQVSDTYDILKTSSKTGRLDKLQTRFLSKLRWLYRREVMGRLIVRKLSPIPCIIPPADIIFLVSSTLRPSVKPMSPGSARSVFSIDERITQTIASLESIRLKVPNCKIVVLENSALLPEDEVMLRKSADLIVKFDKDPIARRLRDGANKGSGEAWMLMRVVPNLKNVQYRRLFKLSARYCLSNHFSVENFPETKIGALRTGEITTRRNSVRSDIHSTRLYCVPKILEGTYFESLCNAFRWTLAGAMLEWALFKGSIAGSIRQVTPIGITGGLGLTGETINE